MIFTICLMMFMTSCGGVSNMATLDQIYAKVEQLRDELAVVVASAKLNPKQITIIQGLSEINASLGVMRAGEFLALSDGEDPQDADGTGTFISALGRTFASKLYHIGGVFNGDLKWGANAITGELEAGDGAVNLTANGLSLYDGATEIGRFGNLNGFLTYTTDTYGMAMGDSNQYMTYDQTNGLKIYGALVSDREILTADRTYYVATTGDDGNDGLAVGTPLLTIQYALDFVAARLDTSSFNVTIQIADGTYTCPAAGFVVKGINGTGTLLLLGNRTTPANVILQTDASTTWQLIIISNIKTKIGLDGMKLISIANADGVSIFVEQAVLWFNNIDFGDAEYAQIYGGQLGYVRFAGFDLTATRVYTISGDAGGDHIILIGCVYYEADGTVTLTGTPNFIGNYIYATKISYAAFSGMTYTGSATGGRAWSTRNSVIELNGETLPGDEANGTSYGGIIL